MKLLHELEGEEPTRPASIGEVVRAYRHNLVRFVILAALFVVLSASFFAYTLQQSISQHDELSAQCEQRRVNVEHANAFYQRVSELLARAAPAGDAGEFARDVARAFAAQVYDVPHC